MSDHEKREPTYRDQELLRLMKALRAGVRPYAGAKAALDRVEQRLRFVLKVIEVWDTSHAARAKELIRLGCLPAANTAATMVFDPTIRQNLLRQSYIGGDDGALARMQEAAELGREVLN